MTVINTLRERIESYEEESDRKLLKKVPVVFVINGRSFKKITSLLVKPFSSEFMELMCATMIKLSHEIDGATFSYTFNDEIVIIARNDQNIDTGAWYDNKIQKMVSVASSLATLEFNRIANMNKVQLFGDPVFTTKAFVVPNITEAINVLVSKQQQAFHISLHLACFYELLKKKHNPDTVRQTLFEKSTTAKAEILFEECNIDFNNYPLPFRRGVAAYRVPKVVQTADGEELKNKLTVDMDLPLFIKEHDFLGNIFRSGHDIIRAK